MNYYQSKFKSDLLNGIFSLTGKTWLNILYAYLIYFGITAIIGSVVVLFAFTGLMTMDDFPAMLANNPTPEEVMLFLKQFSTIFLSPGFIIGMVILFLVVLVLACWNYYFAFLAADTEVKGNNISFGNLFKLSINMAVFKVIGVSILLNIIITVIFFAAIMSATISGLLAFVLFLVAMVIAMRFILVLPAYIIGSKDLNNSFAFSFYHINWVRALKLFGIAILFWIAMIIVALIIGLISAMLSFIPFIGPLIQMGINIFFGAIMMALIVAAIVGLYYRYAEDILENDTTTNELAE